MKMKIFDIELINDKRIISNNRQDCIDKINFVFKDNQYIKKMNLHNLDRMTKGDYKINIIKSCIKVDIQEYFKKDVEKFKSNLKKEKTKDAINKAISRLCIRLYTQLDAVKHQDYYEYLNNPQDNNEVEKVKKMSNLITEKNTNDTFLKHKPITDKMDHIMIEEHETKTAEEQEIKKVEEPPDYKSIFVKRINKNTDEVKKPMNEKPINEKPIIKNDIDNNEGALPPSKPPINKGGSGGNSSPHNDYKEVDDKLTKQINSFYSKNHNKTNKKTIKYNHSHTIKKTHFLQQTDNKKRKRINITDEIKNEDTIDKPYYDDNDDDNDNENDYNNDYETDDDEIPDIEVINRLKKENIYTLNANDVNLLIEIFERHIKYVGAFKVDEIINEKLNLLWKMEQYYKRR